MGPNTEIKRESEIEEQRDDNDTEPLLTATITSATPPTGGHGEEESGVRPSQPGAHRESTPIMDRLLTALPPPIQFVTLSLLVFIFFGVHNYLQEGISRMEGFEGLGSMLGYLEVVGVMVFSFFERLSLGDKEQRVKATSYMQLTLCLLGSSYLSTVGLSMINYPTKVVFRSCKLIPTMAVAILIHRETFKLSEMLSAVAVCGGLILFAFADMTSDTKVSTPVGLILQALSVVADAFLPNLQQKLFKQGASPLEVTYFTNVYVFVIMTIMGGGSGQIAAVLRFAWSNGTAATMLVAYTIIAYVAISCHMRVVQKYGSVVAVLVGNMRKAGTITLSFILFPKPFSMLYVYGTVLVLGGLTTTAYVKDKKRKAKKDVPAESIEMKAEGNDPNTERKQSK